VIDPRQMDLIRRQAELAAQGKPTYIRELPPVIKTVKAIPSKAIKAAATAAAGGGDDPRAGEIQKRRMAALARKRARDAAKSA
jgi:hypothetical protein